MLYENVHWFPWVACQLYGFKQLHQPWLTFWPTVTTPPLSWYHSFKKDGVISAWWKQAVRAWGTAWVWVCTCAHSVFYVRPFRRIGGRLSFWNSCCSLAWGRPRLPANACQRLVFHTHAHHHKMAREERGFRILAVWKKRQWHTLCTSRIVWVLLS